MATGKRAARRPNRRKQKAAAYDSSSPQSQKTVGEVARGIDYNEVYSMAFPNTVTVPDTFYTPEQAEKVTRLRHERWNIYISLAKSYGVHTKEWYRCEKRLRKVTKELYELTGNPIYNDQ